MLAVPARFAGRAVVATGAGTSECGRGEKEGRRQEGKDGKFHGG